VGRVCPVAVGDALLLALQIALSAMSGCWFILGSCWLCHRPFTFNPFSVPSIPIDPETQRPPDLGGDPERARREPICESCVELVNQTRERLGQEQIQVLHDAYEPVAE
jgi:hypothetical protein